MLALTMCVAKPKQERWVTLQEPHSHKHSQTTIVTQHKSIPRLRSYLTLPTSRQTIVHAQIQGRPHTQVLIQSCLHAHTPRRGRGATCGSGRMASERQEIFRWGGEDHQKDLTISEATARIWRAAAQQRVIGRVDSAHRVLEAAPDSAAT